MDDVPPGLEAGPPLLVRTMEPRDVPSVTAIERASFDAGWPPTAFERELTRNAMARYVVLEAAGLDGERELLGFAGSWLQLDEAHVVTVAVRPEHRRRSYGRLLLFALLDLTEREGMHVATLEVRVSNESARALYREFGFYEVGERKRYYSDGEDALIMTTEEFDSEPHRRRRSALREDLAVRFPGVAPTVA
ncbi:MAG: ribosomal protein S18-alanine N-acetyltransferase [Hyphomicrobiales bacterium]